MCAISLKRRGDNELRLRMKDCRVHNARDRKGLPRFPCKSVGLMEFPAFAETVDPRIETTCVQCPPDELSSGGYCEWHYVLQDAK
jgi:hypothetical protein